MGDWVREAAPWAVGAPTAVLRPSAVDPAELSELVSLIGRSRAPALVVGAGAASERGWEAVTVLAETLSCPVWQEPFGSRAGFPQTPRLVAGPPPRVRPGRHEPPAAPGP